MGKPVGLVAPARLHLGFLDMGGHLGRRFGSLGVSLSSPCLRVEVRAAHSRSVRGPHAARVHRVLDLLAEQFGLDTAVQLHVLETIPDHAGLGSGTQLALAVGTLVARLRGASLSATTLARALDRGNRSGIGIGAFEQGGFLLDGGRGPEDTPPPVLARLPFPDTWRIVLLTDPARQGLHGRAEVEAFRRLPVFPQSAAARLCHLTVMQALPALAEARLAEFGQAITEIQATVGDHFAPAQGGRFSSPLVAEALQRLGAQGVTCRGQSSWGPTGFVVAPDEPAAQTWVATLADLVPRGLVPQVVRASNQGVQWYEPAEHPAEGLPARPAGPDASPTHLTAGIT